MNGSEEHILKGTQQNNKGNFDVHFVVTTADSEDNVFSNIIFIHTQTCILQYTPVYSRSVIHLYLPEQTC